MDIVKRNAKIALRYVLAILKWLAVSAVIGAVGGAVGVAFHISVEKVTELRAAHEWIIYLLPVGGLAIAGLYKLFKMEKLGTDNVIESIRTEKSVPFLLAPLIFFQQLSLTFSEDQPAERVRRFSLAAASVLRLDE